MKGKGAEVEIFDFCYRHHKWMTPNETQVFQGNLADDLLQLSNSVSLHQRHLRFLLTEIYKSAGTLNPHTSNTERFHITRDGVQYFSFHPQCLQFIVLTLCISMGL